MESLIHINKNKDKKLTVMHKQAYGRFYTIWELRPTEIGKISWFTVKNFNDQIKAYDFYNKFLKRGKI